MIKYLKLKEINSTNDYARRLLEIYSINEINNTVICTHTQTDGRGVGKNKWYSEPGKNLTFSLIHSPDYLPLEVIFYLSKAVSCSIVDFLEKNNIETKIKWPNDIICKNKKCAGILIENIISSIHREIKASIIGIGLNVNQIVFPLDLNATSMSLLTSKFYDLSYLLNELVEKIYKWLEILEKKDFYTIDKFYLLHLFSFNKENLFRSGNKFFKGTIRGVDQYGRLILELSEKKLQKLFWQKEIEFLNV